MEEVVDMAVKNVQTKIQEEKEETTFKETLMVKIHSLATIMTRTIILRKTIGTKANQSASTARDLAILSRIAGSRPINKHDFQKKIKEKEIYSILSTWPMKSRMICGTLIAVVAIT